LQTEAPRQTKGQILFAAPKCPGPIRTRNAILGKTKTSDGNYYRQLVFYSLLLSLQGNYELEEGVVDFVEPDKRTGKYRREVFSIEKEEVEELKKCIQQTAEEILNMSFWNAPCDKKKSSYCNLRDMMQ